MEEKERYELFIDVQQNKFIVDRQNNNKMMSICEIEDLLNQQDKRIKELENMNSRLSQGIYWGNGEQFCDVVKRLKQKIQQLKQSQKQLAIEQLEKLKEEMTLNGNNYCELRQGTSPHNTSNYAWFNYISFRNFIDNQIEALKGEE